MLARVPRAQAEEGMTLIELLVATVILAVVAVTFMSVMTSLTVASGHHRGLGATDTVVRDYGEAIKKNAITLGTYTKCPVAADVAPAGLFSEAGFTTSVDSVEYWLSTTADDPLNGGFTTDRTKCTDRYQFLCKVGDQDLTRPECDPSLLRVTITAKATAGSMRGGQTTTQVLVRRGNT
jgi:prepilin-type N-terminal cleavage/methylation domain-containing protein